MNEFALTLNFDHSSPLYRQLYRALVEEIQSGRLAPGARLPSKRQLCAHLGVSMSTVETAYGILAAEGYIQARPRSGYRVCDLLTLTPVQAEKAASPSVPSPPPEPAWDYVFSTGAVDTSVFPFSSWAKITKEAVYQNPDLLQRGHPQGDLPLRQALRELLHQYRGVLCQPDQIIVGAGMDYLLGLLMQLLPADAGVALEDPGYPAAYDTVVHSGRRPLPVPVDEQGISPDALERSGALVAHVTPSHQFPLGVTMPMARRTQLLRWAYAREDRFVLEDDYDSEFRYASRPIPALQGLDRRGKVVYFGTFSRSIAPSIRVAYLILPPALLERYRQLFPRAASTVSRFEQEALRRFLTGGQYAGHLRRVGNLYRRRCARLTEALLAIPGAQVSGADAGLHFLFTLPRFSEAELVERAAARRVRVHGLSEYCHGPCPKPSTLVLGYAGMDDDALLTAAARLREAYA